MKKLTTLLALTFAISRVAVAQIVPDVTKTPQELVQDYIVGPGITVSGVTFNGMSGTILNQQIGFFSGNSSIGLDSGVVITSGIVNNIAGPNYTSAISMPWGYPCYDSDILSIAYFGAYDPGILEFDFIPTGDSVSFSFVFGSDEYMEYAGAGINDAFGIFLSGPGISGPYTMGAQNIATIPGGIPVSIDNINAFTNPSYYVNNGDGYTSPYSTDPYYVQYDGFTVRITAKWPVTCGSTYHIKFAIADGYDDVIDSGVFIEAGSFTSSGVGVAVSVPSVGGAGPNSIFEGCALGSSADYTFTRPDTSSSDTLYFTIGGNAINGVDYSLISPSYIVFAPGQDSATISVNVFNDGIVEGTDTLTITTNPVGTGCAASAGVTVELFIHDPYAVIPFAGPDTAYYCPGQVLTFNGTVLTGNPPFDYSWSDGTTGSTVNYTVTSLGSDSIVLSVTDGCGYTGTDTLFMTQVTPSTPLQANAGPDIYYTCPGDTSLVMGFATGGASPYTYLWEGTVPGPSYYYVASSDTVVVLTVTDVCGNTDTDTLYAIQLPPLPLVANAGPDITVTCPGNDVLLLGTATGGGTAYTTLFWTTPSGSTTTTNPLIFAPLSSGNYILTAINTCGQTDTDTVSIIVPPYVPLSVYLSNDSVEVTCPGTAVTLSVDSITGGTAPYHYQWSTMVVDNPTTLTVMNDEVVTLIANDACGLDTTIVIPINVIGSTIDLDFPSGRYCRNSDSTAAVPLTVTGGAAPYSFTWTTEPGGTVTVDSLNMVFNILNPVNGIYNVTITDACGATDTDSGEVSMHNCDLDIPNVMTPNGDGVNDVFYINGLALHPNTILRVYNRWGGLVLYDPDYSNDWDGTGLAAGVYFYIIQLTDGTVPSEYHGYLNIFY